MQDARLKMQEIRNKGQDKGLIGCRETQEKKDLRLQNLCVSVFICVPLYILA